MANWEHGTSGYKHKCRCEICVAAQSAARTKSRYRDERSVSVKLRLDPAPLIRRLEVTEQLDMIDPKTIRRWQRLGMDVYFADKWCLKFGWHPAEVFGQAFYAGCFDQEFAA